MLRDYINIINSFNLHHLGIKCDLAERTAPASGPHPWETARPGYAAHLRGALFRETFCTHGKKDARTASTLETSRFQPLSIIDPTPPLNTL